MKRCLKPKKILSLLLIAVITIISCVSVSADEVGLKQHYEVEYFDIVSKNTVTGEITRSTHDTSATTAMENRGITEWYLPEYIPETSSVQIPEHSDLLISPFSIIGGFDNRQLVSNPSSTQPYKGICQVVTYWDVNNDGVIDDEVGVASGFVNGYSSVVTNGHVIYDETINKWCEYAEVTAARNGDNSAPFGTQTSTTIHTSVAWIEEGDFNQDWAIIEIEEELGKRTGCLGLRGTRSSLNGTAVTLTGYPGDKPNTMWTASGTITSSYDAWLEYDCDAISGQSGSPVYDANRKVLAIHSAEGDPTCNGGVRITEWLFNTLMEFR